MNKNDQTTALWIFGGIALAALARRSGAGVGEIVKAKPPGNAQCADGTFSTFPATARGGVCSYHGGRMVQMELPFIGAGIVSGMHHGGRMVQMERNKVAKQVPTNPTLLEVESDMQRLKDFGALKGAGEKQRQLIFELYRQGILTYNYGNGKFSRGAYTSNSAKDLLNIDNRKDLTIDDQIKEIEFLLKKNHDERVKNGFSVPQSGGFAGLNELYKKKAFVYQEPNKSPQWLRSIFESDPATPQPAARRGGSGVGAIGRISI